MRFVPPAGRVGVFSGIQDTRVHHLAVPKGKKILVLAAGDAGSYARAANLIRKFQAGNEVRFWHSFFSVAPQDYAEQLGGFEPDIVFLPHPCAGTVSRNLYGMAVKLFAGKIGVSYETDDIFEAFDLYSFFGNEGMEQKLKCNRPFKTQLERVRFDLAAKYAAVTAAEEIKLQSLSSSQSRIVNSYPFAERFQMCGFVGGNADFLLHSEHVRQGDLTFVTPSARSFAKCDWLKQGPVLFFSPHHDDMEIAAGFLMSILASMGTEVYNIVLTSGKQGVVGDASRAVKFGRRSAEAAIAAQASGVMALPLPLFDDHPLPLPEEGWEEGAKALLYGLFQRYKPQAIFLPMPDDEHFDHRLTYKLVYETAQQAFRDGRWAQGEYHPNVMLYASPWYVGSNGMNAFNFFPRPGANIGQAAIAAERINAIVGTELAMKCHGLKPPRPNKFGGPFAERVYSHELGTFSY
ncbi:PIG-L deacetylase family protein [Candidatus Margulisiibacteriota bacterium]